MILPLAFLRACRKQPTRPKVVDTTGQSLTCGQLMFRSLALRRILLRNVLADDERMVGLLLPPSAGGVIANAAVSLCPRVAVNLNYTLSASLINSCIRECGIRHVLTSRRVMERLDCELDAELVYLEDMPRLASVRDKAGAALEAYALPMSILARRLGLSKLTDDDLLTIIFTSGSTGEPKGVMLSQRNVAANFTAIEQIFQMKPDDAVVGILPFFHAFGYTCTIWGTLCLDCRTAYHFNPLDAKTVGKLCRESRSTILMGTPTLLRNYLQRCTVEDFATLEIVVSGAERLSPELADAFEGKFGVRPVEGYGATELAPLAAANIPPTRARGLPQPVCKAGTVGRPLPGVEAKVVDLATRRDLPHGQQGMLLIRGPNVMQGYYQRPELTAKVLQNGWYETGDLAVIDADGFISITGRENRFSKIGGEIVPHIKIEDALAKVLAAGPEELLAVVTAIPDARKGERLIVLHRRLNESIQEVRWQLAAEGLPNLWIPGADGFFEVAEIPTLGSGKLDLHAIRRRALELTLGRAAAA